MYMMFLEPFEIKRITGFERTSSQCEELNRLGFKYKINSANQILLLRSHVQKLLDGIPDVDSDSTGPLKLNLDDL